MSVILVLLKIRSRNPSVKNHQPSLGRKLVPLMLPLLGMGIWLGYKQWQQHFLKPEAIFVLGGHEARERFAAELAMQHPHLPVWISSGSPQAYVKRIFAKKGVKRDRLHLDYQAQDTVTNFTTLADQLKAEGIDSVYLITSDNHMNRARLVGEIVFGSRGIAIIPLSVPSDAAPEPIKKSLRDGARAIFWLTTGKTGETLFPPLLK